MSRLKKNIVYNLLGQFLVLALSFVSVKYIHGQLGPDALGLIFFTSLINLLLADVLQTGIAATTVREIASHYESDKQYVRDYIRTSTTLYWGVYFLAVAAILVFAPWFVEHWITLESMDRDTAVAVLRVLGVTSVIVLPRWLYVSLLRGIERMGVTNAIDVSTTALQHLGTIALILLGLPLLHIIYWFGFCYLLRIGIYMLVCRKHFGLGMLLPGFRVYVIKRNTRFTSRLMVATSLGAVLRQLDKLIISKLLPIAAVGYYGFLFSGLSKTRFFMGAFSQAAYPSLSALHNQGNRDSMLKRYAKLQDLLTFLSIPVFALAVYACLPGLTFIFDAEIAADLFAPTVFVCFGLYLNTAMTMPHIYTLAVGNSGISAKQHVLDLLLYPAVAYLLIREFGLTGAAVSFVFLHSLRLVYGARRAFRECLRLPFSGFIVKQLKFVILSLATYGLMFLAIVVYEKQSSLALLSAGYLSASVVFAAGGVFVSAPELRSELSLAVRKYFRPAQAEG